MRRGDATPPPALTPSPSLTRVTAGMWDGGGGGAVAFQLRYMSEGAPGQQGRGLEEVGECIMMLLMT